MEIYLENENLKLEIQRPGERYRGSRFDWTGQITQITFLNKYTFCTNETTDPKKIDILGRGLYNEFGIDYPVGYFDCPVGEKFPKIGIGYLTKESTDDYDFFKYYQITPFKFDVKAQKDRVSFVCLATKHRGYGFELIKTIELTRNGFVIHYSLENLGDKYIQTNEYVHNFLAINQQSIDKNYVLKLPMQIDKRKFGRFINPNNVLEIHRDNITWITNPQDQFFISYINSEYTEPTFWELEHKKLNVGIKEESSFPILRINVWGSSHVVSAEIFMEVYVEPAQKLTWSRSYTLYEL